MRFSNLLICLLTALGPQSDVTELDMNLSRLPEGPITLSPSYCLVLNALSLLDLIKIVIVLSNFLNRHFKAKRA